MSCESTSYASSLRQELIARNHVFAKVNRLPHMVSYGESPVIVYQPSECGRYHGNFLKASYGAILRRPQWRKRLQKVHAQGRRCFPLEDRQCHELDSSMSSDALLMNIFCYPKITRKLEDFQTQRADLVEGYCDFKNVFEYRQLQTVGKRYVSYQLIRNVLAAHALGLQFCVLIDARRPDLLENWYEVVRSIRSLDLRARCKVLMWQELARVLPSVLQNFLDAKYGITAV